MSRAIGDLFYSHAVPCLPDLQRHVLSENDLGLVLATDGVWDGIYMMNDVDGSKNKQLLLKQQNHK
jgi:serine/threonine protein phosphatase PrpC